MSTSEKLKSAVKAKDMGAIRNCLWARIMIDPNFTEGFLESWEYCIGNGVSEAELYEPHDGRPISEDATKENFSKLCGELSTNFSRERLDSIKRIGRILYPPQPRVDEGGTSGTHCESGPHGMKRLVTICAVAAAGVAVGGIVGGLLFRKAVVGAIAGGVAGAAVGAIVGKGMRSNANR